jgi:hypothetical protein
MENTYSIDPQNPRLVRLGDGRIAIIVDLAVQSGEAVALGKRRRPKKPRCAQMGRDRVLELYARMRRGETPEAIEAEPGTPSLYTLRCIRSGCWNHIRREDKDRDYF